MTGKKKEKRPAKAIHLIKAVVKVEFHSQREDVIVRERKRMQRLKGDTSAEVSTVKEEREK